MAWIPSDTEDIPMDGNRVSRTGHRSQRSDKRAANQEHVEPEFQFKNLVLVRSKKGFIAGSTNLKIPAASITLKIIIRKERSIPPNK